MIVRATQIGHDMLKDVPRMGPVAQIILYQDKNYDGSGFPSDKVSGETIPLGARVLKIFKDRAALEDDGVVKKKSIEAMKLRKGSYDPALLEKVFESFPDFLQYNLTPTRPVWSKRIDELEPGLILVSDVSTASGELLLRAGNRLTQTMINRLKNYAESDKVKEPLLVQIP